MFLNAAMGPGPCWGMAPIGSQDIAGRGRGGGVTPLGQSSLQMLVPA
jgi:hypothetical protein